MSVYSQVCSTVAWDSEGACVVLYRKLHKREMNKRIMHQPSYRRLRRAHPAKLDRYNEMQDALYFTKKGYGLRRVLVESGVLVNVITKGLPLINMSAISSC